MNPTSQVAERIDSVVGGPARRQAVTVLGAVLAIDGADKAAVRASAAELERTGGLSGPRPAVSGARQLAAVLLLPAQPGEQREAQ
jgi:hypothetical protein